MSLLRLLFSIRLWLPAAIAAGFTVLLVPAVRVAVEGIEPWIILAEVGVLSVSVAISIAGTYNAESIRDFLLDIKGDVVNLLLSSNSLTYLYATTGFTGNWLALTMIALPLAFAAFDLAFSLNGGASKLLEMDKGRMSID